MPPENSLVAVEQPWRSPSVDHECELPGEVEASCRPVFMPCPPIGLWMCAASPSRKQRPSRKCSAAL